MSATVYYLALLACAVGTILVLVGAYLKVRKAEKAQTRAERLLESERAYEWNFPPRDREAA